MRQLSCTECQAPLVYICDWGVGYKRYRCVDCGTEYILDNKSHKTIETIYPTNDDPPTQDNLYSLTHNLTEEYVELYAHARNCDCPACSGN